MSSRKGLIGPPPGSPGAGTILAAALLSLFLGSSCGGAPPELSVIEWRIELRPSDSGSYESLSVFSSVRDPDGIDDVEALWVVADGAELSWTLDDSNWSKREEGGETWIGGAGLAMPEYGPLPRGDYRVVAADFAGRRTERRFTIPASGAVPAPPTCSVEGGSVIVESTWPETLLLAYDGVGALLKAVQVRTGSNDYASLLGGTEAGRAAALAAYGYDSGRRIGAFSWKVQTR